MFLLISSIALVEEHVTSLLGKQRWQSLKNPSSSTVQRAQSARREQSNALGQSIASVTDFKPWLTSNLKYSFEVK